MLGARRKQTHFEVHRSYFTSLGISIPPNQEHVRARIWPMLVREKYEQKEILVHSRNQAPPSLPLNNRIMGSLEAEWTEDTASADLTQRQKHN
jgi:hypothetical protein